MYLTTKRSLFPVLFLDILICILIQTVVDIMVYQCFFAECSVSFKWAVPII